MRTRAPASAAALVAIFLAVPACDDTPTPPDQVVAVNVVPEELVMATGSTARLNARRDGPGTSISVSWSSTDTSLATVGSDGIVTATSEPRSGIVYIVARAEADPSVRDSAEIEVTIQQPASR